MATTKTQQWVVEDTSGFDAVQLHKDVGIPQLGDHDCLVEMKAVSLNYRDLIIPQGQYPFPLNLPIIPASDGAGTVVAIGTRVNEFQVGDKVCTLFNQGHLAGSLTPKIIGTGLGGSVNGTLREYGVFEETGLVRMPKNLSFTEASTLSCAALTAWNALYGQNALKPGDWVLTQGTGGVSVFAIQFALAAGATVVATTSSDEKGKKLKELGAHHVINYKKDSNWGKTAKSLSPGHLGVQHVIEVGGPSTMAQSLKAIKIDGTITVIGFLGGAEGGPSTLETLTNICNIRGVLVGSRLQFDEMNKAVEVNNIKPIVDKTFAFEKAKDAYSYMWGQNHFGKVVVTIP